MRVYLDNCCFNRPFDDQVLLGVRLETECEVFLTVDKGILRKSGRFPDIRIMSSVEFVMEWEADHAG